MDRIQTMRIFTRVTELSGFTATAEEMGLPKASVSIAVRRLEEQVGVRLLHRTTRRVRPTRDGQVFYERCKDLLADLDDLQSMFQTGSESLRGRLRVDMPQALAQHLVLPRLPEFLDSHPDLQVELNGADRHVDPLREGFDCVLRLGPVNEADLAGRGLGDCLMLNGASPDYLARHGTPQHPRELAGHRLIHYVPALGTEAAGFEYPTDDGYARLPMPGALTVNSTESYEAACLAGLGIIQAPEPALRRLIEQGRLVEILPRWRAAPMPVSLLYPCRRHPSRRSRAFMDWLESILGPYLQRPGAD